MVRFVRFLGLVAALAVVACIVARGSDAAVLSDQHKTQQNDVQQPEQRPIQDWGQLLREASSAKRRSEAPHAAAMKEKAKELGGFAKLKQTLAKSTKAWGEIKKKYGSSDEHSWETAHDEL